MYITLSAEPYILLIILVQRYSDELRVFDRELQDNMYTASAYFAAHFLSSLPQLLIQPLIFAIPIYFGASLRNDSTSIIMFIAINILMVSS